MLREAFVGWWGLENGSVGSNWGESKIRSGMRDSNALMELTYSAMPNEFTSQEFGKRARKEGVSQTFIRGGGIARFLHRKHCAHLSRFIWKKPNIKPLRDIRRPDLITGKQGDDDFEKECVEYLKGLGYKIFKMKEV